MGKQGASNALGPVTSNRMLSGKKVSVRSRGGSPASPARYGERSQSRWTRRRRGVDQGGGVLGSALTPVRFNTPGDGSSAPNALTRAYAGVSDVCPTDAR